MALITCPDCQNEVSDKAPACVHCGNPLTQNVQGVAIFKSTREFMGIGGYYKIYENGLELAKLKEGELFEKQIDKDTEFTVKYTGGFGKGKTVTAYANQINRFVIGMTRLSGGVNVSKVDSITSE